MTVQELDKWVADQFTGLAVIVCIVLAPAVFFIHPFLSVLVILLALTGWGIIRAVREIGKLNRRILTGYPRLPLYVLIGVAASGVLVLPYFAVLTALGR